MKKMLKRTIISLIAILSCLSTSTMIVNAYDLRDVNQDGQVNMADAVVVQQYLYGHLYCPTYYQLDANSSLTVDYNDVICISRYLLQNNYSASYYSRKTESSVSFPAQFGFTPNYAYNLTNDKEYISHSYSTQVNGSYTLYPSSNSISSDSSYNQRLIIGDDDRYEATGEENTGIVKLNINGNLGTGFIVGDHEIATAAHCVYDYDNSNWYSNMGITTYNSNGTPSSTNLTAVEAHIPKDFTTAIKYSDTYHMNDYAVITVQQDLSNYIHFDLASSYNVKIFDYEDVPIYITGCPWIINNGAAYNSDYHLYSCEGNIYTDNNTSIIHVDCDANGGQSGSPIYTITKHNTNGVITYTYSALGIYKGTDFQSSIGSIITKYHLQFYKGNAYLNH